MFVLFWISAAIVGYVYAGYPLLVALWARLADRRPRRAAFAAGHWPSLSVIVAVRNEAPRLEDRIQNLLDQHYPGDVQVIVVSDGSTDTPGARLAPFGRTVAFIDLPPGGKPAALNAGVAAATGAVLVFADARQRFRPGALRALAENFADPAVGGATGELLLDCEEHHVGGDVAEGIGLYWRYEKWLRRSESRVWSTLGATGAIYAMRRACWTPLPPSALLDDVLAPMRAVLMGWRIVFDERAIASDVVSVDAAAESRRKTRTLAGNYQILSLEPRLLVPLLNPVWLQYMSHKIGRLIVPWALMTLLASSAALAAAGAVYALALAGQLLFYGFAAAGGVLHVRERVARVAFTFVMMNLAAIAGLAALRRGREVWR